LALLWAETERVSASLSVDSRIALSSEAALATASAEFARTSVPFSAEALASVSALFSAAVDTFASPELESAWPFASPFAVGQTSDATESVSALFSAENFVVGDTPASMASE